MFEFHFSINLSVIIFLTYTFSIRANIFRTNPLSFYGNYRVNLKIKFFIFFFSNYRVVIKYQICQCSYSKTISITRPNLLTTLPPPLCLTMFSFLHLSLFMDVIISKPLGCLLNKVSPKQDPGYPENKNRISSEDKKGNGIMFHVLWGWDNLPTSLSTSDILNKRTTTHPNVYACSSISILLLCVRSVQLITFLRGFLYLIWKFSTFDVAYIIFERKKTRTEKIRNLLFIFLLLSIIR